MNGNIRLGSLFGIPFYVNPSWFFVLGLVTLSYGQQLALFPQLTGLTPWILGFVAALLLFASVVAHELGHSFAAMAQGIKVNSITLFLFGGLATLSKESKTPFESFWVAISGPLVSFLLFGLFTLISLNVVLPAPLGAVVSLLAYVNLALGIFNLIPGLPLDGGNILKALVWQITGNPNKGIIFASRVGQFFGWLAILIGALGTAGISPVGNIWTLFIGFFLLQNAGFSAQSAKVQDFLSKYIAEDVVSQNSPVISANLSLREFVNDYVIGKDRRKKFLVTDENGQLVGIVCVDDLKKIPTSQWTEVRVSELLQPLDAITTVLWNQPLLEIIQMLEQQNVSQLTVVRENGAVVGLIEKASVVSFLQQQAQLKAA